MLVSTLVVPDSEASWKWSGGLLMRGGGTWGERLMIVSSAQSSAGSSDVGFLSGTKHRPGLLSRLTRSECAICGDMFSSWGFYSCDVCYYHVHIMCAVTDDQSFEPLLLRLAFQGNLVPDMVHLSVPDEYTSFMRHIAKHTSILSDEESRARMDVMCSMMPDLITHAAHTMTHVLCSTYASIHVVCRCCNKSIERGVPYNCTTCHNFSIHATCARLPATVNHLQLQMEAIYDTCEQGLDTMQCKHKIENNLDPDEGNSRLYSACKLPIFTTPFKATESGSGYLHNQCSNLSINLDGSDLHPSLEPLEKRPNLHDSKCSKCKAVCGDVMYRCRDAECDFQLDVTCAWPVKIMHRSHDHRLTVNRCCRGFSCSACQTKHRPGLLWAQSMPLVYACNACDFWRHPHCAALPNAIQHKRHRHPLLLEVV
ncbi:hypothetical protein SASPL_151422 [Salvia splendens]|uniref:Phorbol-ester/DAG-type domain-containing protein n=1 Tax=Salvia splendens TaxID=180675 RepID=A0A8X8W7X9_SALSN|nr:hypothetical protein SASPL_151422 [Salvia splendens]